MRNIFSFLLHFALPMNNECSEVGDVVGANKGYHDKTGVEDGGQEIGGVITGHYSLPWKRAVIRTRSQ